MTEPLEFDFDQVVRRFKDAVPRVPDTARVPITEAKGTGLMDFAEVRWLTDLSAEAVTLGHNNDGVRHGISQQMLHLWFSDPDSYIQRIQVEYPAELVRQFEQETGRHGQQVLPLSSLDEAYALAVHLTEGDYMHRDAVIGLVNMSRPTPLLTRTARLVPGGGSPAKQIESNKIGAIIVRLVSDSGDAVDHDFLAELYREAIERNISVIFDESTTAFGRTGGLVHQSLADFAGIEPFLTILGPSGGGGMPYAALIGHRDAFNLMRHRRNPVALNPMSMAAAMAVLNQMGEGLYENVRRRGEQLRTEAAQIVSQHSWIEGLQGDGLLLGLRISLFSNARRLVDVAREQGLHLVIAEDDISTVRLWPHLTVSEKEVGEIVDALYEACLVVGTELHPHTST